MVEQKSLIDGSAFQTMPKHRALRHFDKGISTISQWTGNEYKNMEKVFVGIVAGAADERVVQASRAIVDFSSYARLESHTEIMLQEMDRAWSAFHENKKIFQELEIGEHSNIPKIHSMSHYVSAIQSHGTLDNTESPERLHIEFAKLAYRATNKRDYTVQMEKWLDRQDAVRCYETYLQWLGAEEADLVAGGAVSESDNAGAQVMAVAKTGGKEAKKVQSYDVADNPGYGHRERWKTWSPNLVLRTLSGIWTISSESRLAAYCQQSLPHTVMSSSP